MRQFRGYGFYFRITDVRIIALNRQLIKINILPTIKLSFNKVIRVTW